MLNKGEQMYHGEFEELIKAINPKRRLFFQFSNNPDKNIIEKLKNKFEFQINDNILMSELSEDKLKSLLLILLENFQPLSMSFEDLPVEETMRSFFINPDQYLKR